MRDALASGVKLYLCEAGLRAKGIKKEELIEGAEPVGYGTFVRMATEAKAVISI